ncbi:MAG TPA: Uma2 family endonuclease [Acidobacteriaceae bacterium]|nr:Uma2 family endonuclease [Acidobacteriaceae bacterium]
MSATTTPVPLAEYLASSYRPDRDYLEGEVKERRLGERPHSLVQAYFVRVFGVNGREWKVWVQPEQRVQVRPERYRVPDICVLVRDQPFENIVTHPPLLCLEILSPGDSLSELQERVDDYAAMGVQHIWTVDPTRRRAYLASPTGFVQPQGRELAIPGTPIRISLDELFAELDEAGQTP